MTLVCLRLVFDALIFLARVLVGGSRGSPLFGPDARPLVFPADVDRFAAPLGTFAAGPNRLAVDLDEHWIGMRTGENPHREPARLRGPVLERQFLNAAVGTDRLGLNDAAVDNQFHRHLTRVANPRAFDVPVGL